GFEAAGLYRTVGIPVVEGLAAFHRGAWAEAVESLLPVRFDLWQIGGSYAQRDVVDWTLTEAAVRAGQRDVALSLAHERLATRSRARPPAASCGTPRPAPAERALSRRSLSSPIVMAARVRRRSPPYLALRRSVTGLAGFGPIPAVRNTRRDRLSWGDRGSSH